MAISNIFCLVETFFPQKKPTNLFPLRFWLGKTYPTLTRNKGLIAGPWLFLGGVRDLRDRGVTDLGLRCCV